MASLMHPVGGVRQYAGSYGPHSHDHAQLLFGLEGGLELGFGARAGRVEPSFGFVIPAGVAHDYGTRKAARVMVVDLPMQAGTDRVRRFAVPGAWMARARFAGRTLDLEGLVAALLGSRPARPARPLDLAAIVQRIDGHLAHRWTVADLAQLTHLSAAQLHLRLQAACGLSPMALVRSRRLLAAQQWLLRGLPLEATALQVGYASASALAYALRREGMDSQRALRAAARRAGSRSTAGR